MLEVRIDGYAAAVDPHIGGRGVGLLTDLRRFAVDGDPAVPDEAFGLPEGGDPGPSDQLVDAFDDDSGRNGRSRASTTSAGGT